MSKKILRLEKFAEEMLGIKLTQEQKKILKAIEESKPIKPRHTYNTQLKIVFKGAKEVI